MPEAAALWWRVPTTPASLARDGRLWTAWTTAIVVTFTIPGAMLLALEPLTAPVALASFAHGWIITGLYAGRGARSVVPVDAARGVGPTGREPERVALGLLGDLLSHAERELAAATGLALQRGSLGVWLVGEQGALLVRPGGRRVDCWCVRIATGDGLPGADRVAHLVLALREDEQGFATVANLAFSGAPWRVRRRLPASARVALDRARELARTPTAR